MAFSLAIRGQFELADPLLDFSRADTLPLRGARLADSSRQVVYPPGDINENRHFITAA
jgi:hypothetical protein